jgi:hypothetical protein
MFTDIQLEALVQSAFERFYALEPVTTARLTYFARPTEFEGDSVPIPVNRAGKSITLVAGICADGSFLKPTGVVPRHTVHADLALFGVSDQNCTINVDAYCMS